MSLILKAEKLCHSFGKLKLFSDISFTIEKGEVLLITGPNGSGKSTLIKILSGFLHPKGGKVSLWENDKSWSPKDYFHKIGMSTPEMRVYEELTGWENLLFFAQLRGFKKNPNNLRELLTQAGLEKAGDNLVKVYSSGMKQRLKLLLAFFYSPPILYLDEPDSNLDERGMQFVTEIIEKQRKQGISVIATNEPHKYSFGNKEVSLAS